VKERVELHNLHTDHISIPSELKYLLGGKVVKLICWVIGGKTRPFPLGRVFHLVRPIATVWFVMEWEPELTREFGPVAHTSCIQYRMMDSIKCP
jgi:hypothetical protein